MEGIEYKLEEQDKNRDFVEGIEDNELIKKEEYPNEVRWDDKSHEKDYEGKNDISDEKGKDQKKVYNEINYEKENRIKIEDSHLKAVYNELRSKNFSLKKISE